MSADDTEPLLINGLAVDPGLLEARPIRRCALVDECQSHCCGGGVYIHTQQVEDILAHHELIQPHLPPDRRDPALWFDNELMPEADHPMGGVTMGTTVVDDPTHPTGANCIFLRPDRKCALQAASIAAGEHPWRFKPFYCALHPITFDEGLICLAEQSEMYLEGGSCNRPSSGEAVPLYRLFETELTWALGEDGYTALVTLAQARGK